MCFSRLGQYCRRRSVHLAWCKPATQEHRYGADLERRHIGGAFQNDQAPYAKINHFPGSLGTLDAIMLI